MICPTCGNPRSETNVGKAMIAAGIISPAQRWETLLHDAFEKHPRLDHVDHLHRFNLIMKVLQLEISCFLAEAQKGFIPGRVNHLLRLEAEKRGAKKDLSVVRGARQGAGQHALAAALNIQPQPVRTGQTILPPRSTTTAAPIIIPIKKKKITPPPLSEGMKGIFRAEKNRYLDSIFSVNGKRMKLKDWPANIIRKAMPDIIKRAKNDIGSNLTAITESRFALRLASHIDGNKTLGTYWTGAARLKEVNKIHDDVRREVLAEHSEMCQGDRYAAD